MMNSLRTHVLDSQNLKLNLQAFDSPLTSRLQRLGASLRMGVVSRRLSPLRGERDGERDLGMVPVLHRSCYKTAAPGRHTLALAAKQSTTVKLHLT